jgi:transposase
MNPLACGRVPKIFLNAYSAAPLLCVAEGAQSAVLSHSELRSGRVTREFKREAVRLIKDRGVAYVQASQDLGVHTSQLRDRVKKLADDPQHAFPGQGQMKPEQFEIAQLKREITKLKANETS